MNERTDPIIITGFMGSGKTSVAAALAEIAKCDMVDLDQLIEQRESRTAQQIIDIDGEPRFREIETEALRETLQRDGRRVIALGGGTWTIERNRTLIESRSRHVIWLDAPFELCWQRIESEPTPRPLARGRAETQALFDARRGLYREGTFGIPISEDLSAQAIAEMIVSTSPYIGGPKWLPHIPPQNVR